MYRILDEGMLIAVSVLVGTRHAVDSSVRASTHTTCCWHHAQQAIPLPKVDPLPTYRYTRSKPIAILAQALTLIGHISVPNSNLG